MSSAAPFRIQSKKTAQSPVSSSRLLMLRRAYMSGVQAHQMATKESGSVVRLCSTALKEWLYRPSSPVWTQFSTIQHLISSSGSPSSAESHVIGHAKRATGTSWARTILESLSGTCTYGMESSHGWMIPCTLLFHSGQAHKLRRTLAWISTSFRSQISNWNAGTSQKKHWTKCRKMHRVKEIQ